MPSIEWNAAHWGGYDWTRRGEEWSRAWGGSESQWYGCILSRIGGYLPVPVLLELAPGHGRWTRFLIDRCEHFIGVDLSTRCVDFCRDKFSDRPHAKFHANDGLSLATVADNSVDFVFSFDSLVHSEDDVLESYVAQIARKFTPDGIGFIHHSNLGACAPDTVNKHGRGISMTADKFVAFCASAGLACISQEIVNWGQPELVDCFSMFAPSSSVWDRPLRRIENPRFLLEREMLKEISSLYHDRPEQDSFGAV